MASTNRSVLVVGLGLLLAASAAVAEQARTSEEKDELASVLMRKIQNAAADLESMAYRLKVGELAGGSHAGMRFGTMGSVLRGAPYSATVVAESVQVLADGNRIVRRDRFVLGRDGEGRVVRQQLAPDGSMRGSVVWDPVANVTHSLDHTKRTALRRPLLRSTGTSNTAPASPNARLFARMFAKISERGSTGAAQSEAVLLDGSSGEETQESLGVTTLEGVTAEGTRTVTQIPAGAVGNERPLRIVAERWHSPDLQIDVLRTRHDPRTGTSTYRLADIRRGEPDGAWFQVPAGYTVIDVAK